jgi:hypothetical protein
MQTTTASGPDTKWTEEAAPVALVGVAALLVPLDEDAGWVAFDEAATLDGRALGTFVPETELSGVVVAGMELDPDTADVSVFPLRTKLSEKTRELDGEQ